MGAGNYYEVLDVKRTCAPDDIKRAFSKLALKYHPQRAKGSGVDPAEAEMKFNLICESYDVLSNPARRAIFDQYGERGLKDGVPDGQGGLKGGIYRYAMNSTEIFTAFFGTSSPFADLFGPMGEEAPEFYGDLTGMTLPKKPSKPLPLLIPMQVTLLEIYNGATKKVSYSRRKLQPDNSTKLVTETIHIRVVPGWADGTVCSFEGAGDEGVDIVAADVQVMVETLPDVVWARDGDNLIYTASISLCDALTNCIIEVPTFDGRILSIPMNQVIAPGVTKTVPGEGMPNKDTGVKGDLVLAFDIKFPEELTVAQKASLKKLLP